MSGGTFSKPKTYVVGETITASDANAGEDTIINNMDFSGLGDYSTNAAEMRTTRDPNPGGTISLPTDGKGELGGLRYQVLQILKLFDISITSWEKDVPAPAFAFGAKGADVASANALTLGTDGNYFDITGTTNITSIGTLGIGSTVTLHFDDVLTLTHHATDLVLPGAANITTAAGDEAIFVEYATGDWRCINYSEVSGEPLVVSTIRDTSRGLIIKYVTAATLDIDADEIVLQTTTNTGFRPTSINLTVDITASGLNGLDTGSEASSTWYYIWVISNRTTEASLLSLSSTAPTMPSGYTYKALVGAVRNNGSSNLVDFHQIDDRVFFTAQAAFDDTTGSVSWTSADISVIVPPTAKTVGGNMGQPLNGTRAMAVSGNSLGYGMRMAGRSSSGTDFLGFYTSASFTGVPLITAQTIYWYAEDTLNNGYRLDITSYTL